jgi:glutamyl-tRNA synthetase
VPDVPPVVRFKNPQEGVTIVDDLVRGRVAFDNAELDDLIIARSDGTPTYNFCVVVDDLDMRITHVIRGDDHLNNTPRQMNMLRAMGVEPPVYAHLPMILGPDGTKLSKRHGAVSVLHYREEGYLPEALLNYLARLGWSHGDQEIFTLEEMTALFDIADVNKSASAINPEKLAWINQQHLMREPPARIVPELRWQLARLGVTGASDATLEAVVLAQRERSKTLREMAEASRFFFAAPATYDEKAAKKHLTAETAPVLERARGALAGLPEWTAPGIHEAVQALAAAGGLALGKVAQPLRVAVSGGGVSPPIDQTLAILGREETLRRLDRASEHAKR